MNLKMEDVVFERNLSSDADLDMEYSILRHDLCPEAIQEEPLPKIDMKRTTKKEKR